MRRRSTVRRRMVSLLVAVASVGALGAAAVLEHDASAQPGVVTRTGPPAARASVPSTSPATDDEPGQPSAPDGHVVLALGDSVPSGHACGCRPFPDVYGALLGRRTGTPVTVDNRAVSGLQTAGVMAQLRSPEVQAAIRRADVVLVMIGANDFGDHHDQVVTGRCDSGDSDCVSDELGTMRDHLGRLLATVRSLRQGRPTTVLVSGYWNVFEDGDVARQAYGEDGLRASLTLTRRANAAIRSVSEAAGARYVDLFGPFEQSGRDVTSLLAADGDHPDAAGHALIARVLLAAGLPRLD